jgi:hypothetical protein
LILIYFKNTKKLLIFLKKLFSFKNTFKIKKKKTKSKHFSQSSSLSLLIIKPSLSLSSPRLRNPLFYLSREETGKSILQYRWLINMGWGPGSRVWDPHKTQQHTTTVFCFDDIIVGVKLLRR